MGAFLRLKDFSLTITATSTENSLLLDLHKYFETDLKKWLSNSQIWFMNVVVPWFKRLGTEHWPRSLWFNSEWLHGERSVIATGWSPADDHRNILSSITETCDNPEQAAHYHNFDHFFRVFFLRPILAYLPFSGKKIIVCLCDHHAFCLSVYPSH
jgi:hypothetical protein